MRLRTDEAVAIRFHLPPDDFPEAPFPGAAPAD
jgi:hypothetical protein